MNLLDITKPHKLFPKDIKEAHVKFKALARVWHPDKSKNPKANDVFTHIKNLYDKNLENIKEGIWGYIKVRKFELGIEYIFNDKIVYLIEAKHEPILVSTKTKGFSYANEKMKKEFEKYLPQGYKFFKEVDDSYKITVNKDRDIIVLKDVVDYFGGNLDSKHVCWIMSSLYNLVCYFNYVGISHNDISMDTYFIHPKNHYGVLLGGWWYSKPFGTELKIIPSRTYKYLPWEAKNDKKVSLKTDLELIRALGRELLGNNKAPDLVKKWLDGVVNSETAMIEYREWNKILNNSGPRIFHKMELNPNMIYI